MTAQIKRGFTLIELLIVMAILGVLAVVVLVAINPVQQLARTRDAGRKSGIAQIGRAMEAYFTSHGGVYIPESATWISGASASLVASGEISAAPATITNSLGTTCSENADNGWCYDATATEAVIYTVLESQSEDSKCPTPATQNPIFVWSTADGRGGLVCSSGVDLNPGNQSWNSVQ